MKLTATPPAGKIAALLWMPWQPYKMTKNAPFLFPAALRPAVDKKEILKAVNWHREQRDREHGAAQEEARKARLLRMVTDPVVLINKLEQFFSAYIYLPQDGATVLALWVMNTWTFQLFQTVPYLLLQSATPGCGKTTVLDLLEKLCARPRQTISMSEAVLFRMVERDSPTLLVDEAEVLRGKSDRADALRAIAHAGYKRGTVVYRCVGEQHDLQEFHVFGPKCFAAIGGLRGPLLDRCIVIQLDKLPAQVRLRPAREKSIAPVAQNLRVELEAYALQVGDRLTLLYDQEPAEGYWPALQGREAEIWTALLLHCRLAGPETEQRGVEIARQFSGRKMEEQSEDDDFALVAELVDVLENLEAQEFTASELVTPLVEKDSWGELLAAKREDKAKAGAVGCFLRRFRPPSRILHGRRRYNRQGTLAKLRSHMPQNLHPSTPAPLDPGESVNCGGEDRGGLPIRVSTLQQDTRKRRRLRRLTTKVVIRKQPPPQSPPRPIH